MEINGAYINGATFVGSSVSSNQFEITYLVVAGGGGGGQRGGGGGGGGGYRQGTLSLNPSLMPLTATINIGSGGSGAFPGLPAIGVPGNPSEIFQPVSKFSPIAALGGGAGGGSSQSPIIPQANPTVPNPSPLYNTVPGYLWANGRPGGSGGGSGGVGANFGPVPLGSPTLYQNIAGTGNVQQGFPGGVGGNVNTRPESTGAGGGGGGGAGQPGGVALSGQKGGDGGVGYTWPVTGNTYCGGGGGGGASLPPGYPPTSPLRVASEVGGNRGPTPSGSSGGAPGGGGKGGNGTFPGENGGVGLPATVNSGGGGGGGGWAQRAPTPPFPSPATTFDASGSAGASGIVILQYPGGTVRGTFSPAPAVTTLNPGSFVRHTVTGSTTWTIPA